MTVLGLALAGAFAGDPSKADDSPWSLTGYGGVVSDHNFTQILGNGTIIRGHNYGHGFSVNNAMFGVAADRKLFYLGARFWLAAEGQLTVYTLGHNYASGAIGAGLQFDGFPWRDQIPTVLSVYTGPSYAVNPPKAPEVPFFRGKALLNYLGVEVAVALPRSDEWDAVFRIYHRSGVWGGYSLDDDESSMIGLGLRKRF